MIAAHSIPAAVVAPAVDGVMRTSHPALKKYLTSSKSLKARRISVIICVCHESVLVAVVSDESSA